MFRILSILLAFPLLAFGASLHLTDDYAWLEVDNAGVAKVLDLFRQRGVEVLVDPSLRLGRVSGSWEHVKVDRLIQQLIAPHDYLLEWKRVPGPLGELYQISSIRVFSDGKLGSLTSLSPEHRVLDIVEGPDGTKYVRGEIMVGFGEGASLDDLKALLKELGGTVVETIEPPGIYRIKLNDDMTVEQALEIAKAHQGVKSAEPNLAHEKIGSEPVSLADGVDSGINLHLQPGETAVAVLDSGLDPQYANLPFIRGMYNALNPSEAMSDPTGHGTLTAMVASGAITPLGADPAETGVPVLAIRVFDENGYTSNDTIMRALNFAIQSGVGVVSMSWGSDVDSQFMEAAMNYAAQNGPILFAAAGNEPTGTPIYPAGYDSVIAVGGLDSGGQRWSRSNYGDFVRRYGPAYVWFNGSLYAGTSVATPSEASKTARK